MINEQPIEKRVRAFSGYYDVHSVFDTIQGEGPFTGVPAVFVRLAGCNLRCPLCDTDYTKGRSIMHVDEVVDAVERYGDRRLVVITGGEPFRQHLTELCRRLVYHDKGYFVQIETNGTLEPSFGIGPLITTEVSLRRGVYIVCSPKTGKVDPLVWSYACCAKYVGAQGQLSEADGLPTRALDHTANPLLARPPADFNRPVYLQPVDVKDQTKNLRHREACRQSCMAHGHTLQVQFHKLLGME